MEFKGTTKGVKLEKRGINDDHIIVVILVEDDGEWYAKDFFSSYYIDELIEQLQEAKKYIETQTPDMFQGEVYGYKFINSKG